MSAFDTFFRPPAQSSRLEIGFPFCRASSGGRKAAKRAKDERDRVLAEKAWQRFLRSCVKARED